MRFLTFQLLLLNGIVLTFGASSSLHALLKQVKDESHIQCSTIISRGKSQLDIIEEQNPTVLMSFNPTDETLLGSACHIYVFLVEDAADLKSFFTTARSKKIKMAHFYLIIIEKKEVDVTEIFQTTFIAQAHNLIIVQKAERKDTYRIHSSKLTESDPVRVINILDRNTFIYPKAKLFPQKLQNFEGQHLTAATFGFEPCVTESKSANGSLIFGGFETRLATELSKVLNFRLNLKHPERIFDWISLLEDVIGKGYLDRKVDKYTQVQNGVSDFLYANFYEGEEEFYDNSAHMYQDQYCLVAKRPESYSGDSMGLYLPLSTIVWISTLSAVIVGVVFLLGCSSIARISCASEIINLWAVTLQQGGALPRKNQARGIRIFFVIFSMMMFIIFSGYRGTLVSFLTLQPEYSLLSTLKDAVDSGMPVANIGAYLLTIMRQSRDSNVQELLKHVFVVNSAEEGLAKVETGKALMYEGRIFLEDTIRKKRNENMEWDNMYIVNECWRELNAVLVLKKNSPFTVPFNRKIDQLKSAGIINKWIRDSLRAREDEKNRVDNGLQKIRFAHLKGPLYLWSACISCSICCLVAEVVWHAWNMPWVQQR